MFDVANLYAIGDGQWDVSIFIFNGDNSIDEPLRKIFNHLLPTEGAKLYEIVNHAESGVQEIELDNRLIKIKKGQVLAIYVSPINK